MLFKCYKHPVMRWLSSGDITYMVKLLVSQSCLTLYDLMDCSLPDSSVHGMLQARILEWVAIPFSRGIFQTQGLSPRLLHCRQVLYHLSLQGSPIYMATIVNNIVLCSWNLLNLDFRILFLNTFIYFNWRLITLQYCSGFYHT